MQPKADPRYHVVEELAKRVETASGGRMQWELFAGDEIVPGAEVIQGVRDGIIDAGASATVFVMDLFPQAGLFFQVAGGMTPIPQALWYMEGGGIELCREMFEPIDSYPLASYCLSSPEVWAHSTKPLNTPADFNGLKMRALGDPANIIGNMGAAVVTMFGGEIYESTQRGVIDCFEMGTFGANWGMGFQEVAQYVYQSASRGPTDLQLFHINKQSWNELPPDLQKMLESAVWLEAFKFYSREIQEEAGFIQKFKDYGCDVQPLPKAVEDEFARLAKEYYDEKSAEDPFFAKVVESQRAFKAITDSLNIH
jgi:TRAP-type mannitol/chloroaromatic compound transport system substrate-binding protein